MQVESNPRPKPKPIELAARRAGLREFRGQPKGCTNKFTPADCPHTQERARQLNRSK